MFRITTPLTMSVGNGVTWREWIHHPKGGALSESDLQEIVDSEQDKRDQKMSALFRRFTDQLMGSLSALGAP